MFPALRSIVLLYRGTNLLEAVVLVCASAAVVVLFRRRLARCLPLQLPRMAIPFRGARIAGQSIISRCAALEERLSGIRRGVDEQLGERLATLDRLIDEADREIVRLRACLRETTAIPSDVPRESPKTRWNWLSKAFTSGPDVVIGGLGNEDPSIVNRTTDGMTAQQLRMIRDLSRAGHSNAAIAELINRPKASVERLLADEPTTGLSEAA